MSDIKITNSTEDSGLSITGVVTGYIVLSPGESTVIKNTDLLPNYKSKLELFEGKIKVEDTDEVDNTENEDEEEKAKLEAEQEEIERAAKELADKEAEVAKIEAEEAALEAEIKDTESDEEVDTESDSNK